MKKVSIIMAVYNEKNCILQILEKVKNVEIGLQKEIIIVDGFSTDGTRDILRCLKGDNIKVIYESKRAGKGIALRTGFEHAEGDVIILQDADLEVSPLDYSLLLKPIMERRAEVVYGSRFLKGRGKASLINFIGNSFVTWVVNLLFFVKLSDIETCYKVFKSYLIKDMLFCCRGFDFDAELTSCFLKKKIKIYEVPISYNPRNKKEGKKLHWSAAIPSIRAIIKKRFFK